AKAVAMYARFPDLLHGPFKTHILLDQVPEGYPDLTAKLLAAGGDEALLDYLASRTAGWNPRDPNTPHARMIQQLAGHYAGLRSQPAVFARRLAAVLGQVSVAARGWRRRAVLRPNALLRLFLEHPPAH